MYALLFSDVQPLLECGIASILCQIIYSVCNLLLPDVGLPYILSSYLYVNGCKPTELYHCQTISVACLPYW